MPRRVLPLELSAAQLMLHLSKSKYRPLHWLQHSAVILFPHAAQNPNACRRCASLLACLETS